MGVYKAQKDFSDKLLVLNDPAPKVFFENYGDSSIDFYLAIWVDDPSHRKRVSSDLRLMIWKEFGKHGIKIPFPQRDLHIRSAIPAEISKEVLRSETPKLGATSKM